MKFMLRKLVAAFCLTVAMIATAEAQNSFAYQAVIRTAKGELVSNQKVGMKFSLIYDGKVVYSETHTPQTNQYGNVQVEVGKGKNATGDFAKVPWSTMQVMMKIEADPNGGTNYIDLGTIQLQPAPYAMYAPAAGAVSTVQAGAPKSDSDALFEVKDKDGNVVFAVYPDGVRVFVDDPDSCRDASKAISTGFAVAGRRAAKEGEDANIFAVNAAGTQVFVGEGDTADSSKVMPTGFAVSGRKAAKDGSDLFTVGSTGTQVYIDEDATKAISTGFAVAGRRAAKDGSTEKYMEINTDGTRIYVDNEDDSTKAVRTGFAVSGRRGAAKGDSNGYREKILEINADGTKIYVGDPDSYPDSKAIKTGFAVSGRRGAAKGKEIKLFEVNSFGTQIYIDAKKDKAMQTGFAVSGRRAAKDGPDSYRDKYMVIDADGTVIYVDYETAKAMRTGFAVSGRKAAKDGEQNTILKVNNTEGTRVYIDDVDGKAMQTGFAVSGRKAAKEGESNFMSVVNGQGSITSKSLTMQDKESDKNLMEITPKVTAFKTPEFVVSDHNDSTLLSADTSGVGVNTELVIAGDVAQTVDVEVVEEVAPVSFVVQKIDTISCAKLVPALNGANGYMMLKIYGIGLFAPNQAVDAENNAVIMFNSDGNLTKIQQEAAAVVLMTDASTPNAKLIIWPLKQANNLKINFGLMAAGDTTNRYVNVDAFINVSAPVECLVDVKAEYDSLGTVAVVGPKVYGEKVDLVPQPVEGYHFTQWSDGRRANPRTVLILHDTAFASANFEINTYNINTKAENGFVEIAGKQNDDGTYDHGTEIKLTAIADEHYHFMSWTDSVTTAERQFIIKSDTTFTPLFALDRFTISVESGEGGSAAGGGTFEYGTEIELTATADAAAGYHFTQWSDGDNTNPRKLKVKKDMQLKAVFTVNSYTVAYIVDDEVYGKTEEVDYGSELTLREAPPVKEGYTFSGWSSYPELPKTMPMRNVTITGEYNLNFHTLKYVVDSVVYKTIDSVYYGTALTPIAKPDKAGYSFSGWNGLPETMPDSNVVVTGSFTVKSFTVKVEAENGTVTGSGEYDYGTKVNLVATESEGYHFEGWSDDASIKDQNRNLVVTSDTTITAIFAINSYEVTARAQGGRISLNAENPTISQAEDGMYVVAKYNHDDMLYIEAVALEGYYFNNWSGIELSEDLKNVPSLNFNVKSKLDIIANFIKINYVQTKSVVGTVYRPGNVWFTAGGMTTDRADLISIDSDGAAVVEIPYYENEADSWAVQFNNLLTGFDGQAEGQRFELTFDAKWESDIDSDEATISIWSGLRFTQDGIYNGDFQWTDDNKDLIFDNGLEFSDSDNATRKVKKNEWTTITWGGTIGSTGADTIGVQINLVDGKNQNNYGKFRFKNVTVKFGKGTVAKYFYQPVDNLCKITAPDNVDTKGLVYGLGYYQKGDEVKLWSGATGGDYVFKGWTTDGTNIIEGATEPTYTFRASGNLAIWPMFEPITVHSSYYLGTWADRITNEWFVDASFNNYGVNENDEAYYMFDAPEQNPWNAQFCAIFKNLPNQEVGKEFSLEFEAKWVPLYDTVKRNAASIQMVTGKMLYYNESSCYQWTENNTELVNAEGKFDESVRSIVTKVGRDWTTINWNGYIGNYGANEETDEESPYYGEGGVVGIQMNMIDTNKIVTDGNSGTFYFRNIVVKMGGEVVAEYYKYRPTFNIYCEAINGEGTFEGTGARERNKDAIIKAVPAAGYKFVRWQDGVTNPERSYYVHHDIYCSAIFCEENLGIYDLELSAEGYDNAMVTGSGRYYEGEEVEIYAESPYFEKWSDGNTDNPRWLTIAAPAEGNTIKLTAQFNAPQSCTEFISLSTPADLTYVVDKDGNLQSSGDPFLHDIWVTEHYHCTYGKTELTASGLKIPVPDDAKNSWDVQFCNILEGLENMQEKTFKLSFDIKWVSATGAEKTGIILWTGKNCGDHPDNNDGDEENNYSQFDENNTELVNVSKMPYAASFTGESYNISNNVQTTVSFEAFVGYKGRVGLQLNLVDESSDDHSYGTYYISNVVIEIGGNVVSNCFAPSKNVTISGSADGGEIQGTGTYERGSTVTLTAAPADGYQFVRWSDGYTYPQRTITADNDYNFGAVFCDLSKAVFTISAAPAAGSISGAKVTGSGRYFEGETVVIKAEPVESFVEWNDGDKTNPRVITGITDIELTASFAQMEEIPIDNVVNYDDNNDWYLSGFCDWGEHIVYNGEAKVEFHAELGNNSEGESIAKSWNAQFCNIITGLVGQEQGKEFMLVFDAKWVPDESTTRESAKIWLLTGKKKDYQWNIGNSELLSQSGGTNDNVHNFQTSVGRDWTTIAWGGIIGAEGVYQIGVQINLIDESVEDHNNGVFWFRNVKLLINGIVVREYFTKPQEQSRVSAFASFGTVSGLGYYANGASATLQVNPYEGYTFLGWNDGATDNPRTITVSGDTYLFTSLFDAPEAQVVVTTNSTISQVEINGTVTTVPTPAKENGSNIYTINCHRGDKVQIVVSETGKAFFGWVDDTQKTVCEAASYTFKVDNDKTELTAMFEETIEVTLGGLRYEITDKTAQTCQLVQAYSDKVSGAVTIPDKVTIGGAEYTVTSIAGNAFAYNNNLTSVTIPEGVTSIGGLAFSNCSSMTSLSIPSTIEFIGDNAFEGCNLQYSNDGYAEYLGNGDKNYVLVNYTGSSEEPVIDANCKFIYQKAFEYNSSIKTLTVPGSVKGIGYQAFHGCSQLQSATIEDGVTYIAEKAFDDCPQLTTVSIPNSIEDMEQDVFWSCNNLKYKEYGNAKYLGNNENQYLCLANASSDITSCQIHEACRFILNNAFESCSSLTEINIPNAIEYIGNYAFNGCSGLVNVTIPETIKYIGYLAFNNVVNINYNGNCGEAEETWGAVVRNGVIDGKFVYSSADTDKATLLRYIGKDAEVTIPNSVTFIGHGAFSSCTNLTNVTITDNVSRIGDYAFEGCTGIKSLDVPSSVTTIGDYAFSGVGNINYNGNCGSETDTWGAQTRNATVVGDFIYQDADKKILLKYVGNDSEVVVPGSVTDISANAFKGSKEMTKITIPASVENIGENAFSDCWNLETAEFASIESMCGINYAGNAESWEEIYSNPLSRAHNLFVNGVKITELEIPSGVESISPQAFYGGNFTSVSIPSSVKSIGAAAFKNCNQLATVTIAEGVETIDNFAFNGCCFAQFRIPNTVTTIGNYAFGGCTELNTVYIPSSVETMGSYVFDSYNICCQHASLPTTGWDSYWCYGTPIWGAVTDNNGIVYAQTEDGLGNAMVVGYIGDAVNSLEIPASIVMGVNTCAVTAIRSRAFCNSKVISIDVPVSVVSIDYDAFGDSDANRKVVNINYSGSYGEGNDTWGALYRNYAVDGDFVYTDATKTTILKYVGKSGVAEIQSGVTTIGQQAFYNSNVVSVTIPASVTTIESNAFYGCENLQSVVFAENSELTTIGQEAFYSCKKLMSIEIPDGVTSIGFNAFAEGVINLIYSGSADGDYNNWGAVVRNGTVDGDFIYADAAKTQLVKYTGNGGEVTIPTTVTSIGESAFYNCGSLTSVSIVASVKNIGSSAFNNCNGLKTVTLAEGVENIADYAFSNCYVLENITIPTTIKTVGSNVFLDCENLNGTTSDNVIYLGTQANPYTLLLKATSTEIASCEINTNCKIIYQNAFMGCYNLKSLDVPDGVINIGDGAFSGVKNINYTGLADAGNAEEKWGAEYRNATVMGDFIYKNSSKKTIIRYIGNESEVEIPIGVDTIASDAFKYCYAITKVSFLASVTTIEGAAFYGCSYLASVSFATGSKLASVGANAFYECSDALFETDSYGVIYLKNGENNHFVLVDLDSPNFESYEIPQSCQVICQEAFSYYTDLKSVSFASGSQLVGIGENAFSNCSNLTSITDIPSGVTTIGNYAFDYCENLATVTFVVGGSQLTSIGDGAFRNCALTDITIPSNVTTIGYQAFKSCSSLASVSFASGSKLASIGERAFYECASLTSITIPSSVTAIGDEAFNYCSNLATVTFAGSQLGSIGYMTFANTALTGITIPSSVETIGNNAFSSCPLQTINFAASSQLHSIGEHAFCCNSNLTEVTIPNGVETISDCAFSDCLSLQKAIIPASVTTMGSNVFCSSAEGFIAYCAATEKPTTGWSDSWDNKDVWDNKIEVVWNSDGTTGFKYDLHTGDNNTATVSRYIPELGSNDVNVVIPSEVTIDEVKYSVTAIAGDAFASCRQVSSVFIPASVTTMGSGVFTNMGDGWAKIYCEATTPGGSWPTNWWCNMEVVLGSDGDAGFSFEYYDGYAAITQYTGEQTNIVVPTMVIERGEDKTPLTITTIGDGAFANNYNLQSVTFADGSLVETIGNNAFYYCYSLTSITIPAEVTTIGSQAFYNCYKLQPLLIPNSVEVIGSQAFYYNLTLFCEAQSKPDGWDDNWQRSCIVSWGFSEIPLYGYADIDDQNKTLTITSYNGTETELTIPATLKIGEDDYAVTAIGNSAFHGKSITKVSFAESCQITTIGESAFSGCSSMTSITLPESITTINRFAFSSCSSLTTLTIPKNVVNLEPDYTFTYCPSLQEINVDEENTKFSSDGGVLYEGTTLWRYPSAKSGTSFTIPEGITQIEYNAFQECMNLQVIELPSTVTYVDNYAFGGSTTLAAINVNVSAGEFSTGGFYSDNGILYKKVGEKSILYRYPQAKAGDAFAVTVDSIYSAAFAECQYLKSVYISGGVGMDEVVFQSNEVIEHVTFPSDLIEIPGYTFQGCSSLKSIAIPATVKKIGSTAFQSCYNLETIYFGGTEEDKDKMYIDDNCNEGLQNAELTWVYGTYPAP